MTTISEHNTRTADRIGRWLRQLSRAYADRAAKEPNNPQADKWVRTANSLESLSLWSQHMGRVADAIHSLQNERDSAVNKSNQLQVQLDSLAPKLMDDADLAALDQFAGAPAAGATGATPPAPQTGAVAAAGQPVTGVNATPPQPFPAGMTPVAGAVGVNSVGQQIDSVGNVVG